MIGVLGYLVQCDVCPQKALLDHQVVGWLCPRCLEVSKPATTSVADMRVGCSLPTRIGAVAISDTCQSRATSAVEDVEGSLLYRCDFHRGIVRNDEQGFCVMGKVHEVIGGGFGDVDVAAAERPDKQKLVWQGRAALTFYVDPTEDPDLGSVQG